MRKIGFFFTVVALLIVAGCGEHATEPEPEPQGTIIAMALPDDWWDFMQPYVILEDDAWPVITGSRGEAIPYELTENCDVYSVTFAWSDLFGGIPNGNITDWSGTVSLNADGVVHVLYEIGFEAGQDSVLATTMPSMAAWASSTAMDFDGLSFLVFVPRDNTGLAEVTLTFETELITLNFTTSELKRLAAFYPVDDSRGVGVFSRLLWQPACPGGLIDGHWVKDAFGSGQGNISATWRDYTGEPIGYFTGAFWTNEDGRGEFSGTVSGYITDHVIAEVSGRWYYDDYRVCPLCGEGHGFFSGTFMYLDREGSGRVWGEFGDMNLAPDETDLPMLGIWREDCLYGAENDIRPVLR